MFDELEKYKETDHFFYQAKNDLAKVCNAPADKGGVYLVYVLKGGRIELVYIGRCGEVKPDGSLFIRKGGLKDHLINGTQFGGAKRRTWKERVRRERIEALDIYWYVTHNNQFVDCPRISKNRLLQTYRRIFGDLPPWDEY